MLSSFLMFIISVVFFLMYLLFRRSDSVRKNPERYSAVGRIEKTLESDGGSTYYLIAFTDGVQEYRARTEYYSYVPPKRYRIGDSVPVLYSVTEKGRVHVSVDDPEMIPISKKSGAYLIWILVLGIAFMAMSVINLAVTLVK